ncbi:MAG: hypothetical protein LW823_02845 [Rickettsiales bacterium]|jgi:hypothetical protein|nr:hypothetical protein [Rickettsiales bacterium]
MSKKKTWAQKRDYGKNPHIKSIDKAFAGIPAGSSMLIPSPKEIDHFIRTIPKGSYVDPAAMRTALAAKHKADATCPVSTGIFLRIVAEAALEEYAAGTSATQITPFWRVVESGSALAKKLSADVTQINIIRKLAGE